MEERTRTLTMHSGATNLFPTALRCSFRKSGVDSVPCTVRGQKKKRGGRAADEP